MRKVNKSNINFKHFSFDCLVRLNMALVFFIVTLHNLFGLSTVSE